MCGCENNKKNKKCCRDKKWIAKKSGRKFNDKELFRLAKKLVDLKKLKRNLMKTKSLDKKNR